MRVKAALVVLAVLFTGLPFVVVHLIPTDSPEPYVFRARLAEKLGETLQGKLRYFLAEEMEGRAPARTFVVTIDSAVHQNEFTSGTGGGTAGLDAGQSDDAGCLLWRAVPVFWLAAGVRTPGQDGRSLA